MKNKITSSKISGIPRPVLVLLLGLFCIGTSGPAQTWSPEQQEIIEVVDWVWENVKAGDSSHVSDGFVGWHTGWHAPYTKDESMPWFSRFQSKNKTILVHLSPLAIEIYGDVAIAFYTYRLLREDKDGDETIEEGRWVDTYRKENGKWLLIAESGHVTSSE